MRWWVANILPILMAVFIFRMLLDVARHYREYLREGYQQIKSFSVTLLIQVKKLMFKEVE